ncbi:hypothetical protein G9A89_000886 [Geosiphon pyriformis]|nr:hypothetical protein G9A89_000886 [Geosiphon pyriformis]
MTTITLSDSIEPIRQKQKIKRLLIGTTGSVASIKVPVLVKLLTELDPDLQIKICATKNALHFFDCEAVTKIKDGIEVLTDENEWKVTWNKISDPVMHIELRNWADAFLIAPLDANTLGKIANGLCDNLITCVLRAWDLARPVVVFPAMNTNMWNHPFTARHLSVLRDELEFQIVDPVSKTLACGDTGIGAMAEVGTIVEYVRRELLLLD